MKKGKKVDKRFLVIKSFLRLAQHKMKFPLMILTDVYFTQTSKDINKFNIFT